jgi:hypothetical protein
MDPALYDDDRDRLRHEASIDRLARDEGLPRNEVQALYERELAHLKASARVKDFLAILISRRVRNAIVQREAPPSA